MDELARQLKAFSMKYQTMGEGITKDIETLIKGGMAPKKAVEKVFQKYNIDDWLKVEVENAILATAQDVLGKELAETLEAASILEALSNPWDGSQMNLSQKLHSASVAMKKSIVETIKEQLKRNQTVKHTAEALYDGYNHGHVVKEQMLPKYLQNLLTWTRRSRETLSETELLMLQREIRQVKRQADKLIYDNRTFNHYKTSLYELLAKMEKGTDHAIHKVIWSAVQEKSRYVAERIARTEAARARYDAFLARYGEEEKIVAYRWKLGSRHPMKDICDMYADADLYGLGKGIFPKDKAPVSPSHPHCLCHYAPVYKSELEGKDQRGTVEENGHRWLKNQPLGTRQNILGVKGEEEWKQGFSSWMELARNLDDGMRGSRLADLMQREEKNGVYNDFSIDKKLVGSKEFHDKFEGLSEHKESSPNKCVNSFFLQVVAL